MCVNSEVDRSGNVFIDTDTDITAIVLKGKYITKNQYCNLHITESEFQNLTFCSKVNVGGTDYFV